jgi:general nucleoside transport system permease protein
MPLLPKNLPIKLTQIFLPIFILLLALLINALIMLACGYQPVLAFSAMYRGALGGPRQITETFVKTCPLLLTGLAVAFAFRCGVWNIGAEGQYIVGTLITTWIGTSITNLPPLVFIPFILAAGFVAGGLWGAVAGLLKAYRGVQEVISTIMLNFIALALVSYAVDGGPLQEATKSYQQSERIAANALLPRLIPKALIPFNRFHLGILFALILGVGLYYLLFHTVLGYQVRAVGQNPVAARVAGINVSRNIVIAMLISGGLAGLAGAVELTGISPHRLYQNPPGYGYTAIAVALLGRLHPIGVIFSALLFGVLQAGSEEMQMVAQVPPKLTWVTQATVLLLVLGFSMYEARKGEGGKTEVASVQ